MRIQLNRYQVLLDGVVIYRNKNRGLAMVYFRSACAANPYRSLRMLDTHTGEYVERS
jgi:hypothetical protein